MTGFCLSNVLYLTRVHCRIEMLTGTLAVEFILKQNYSKLVMLAILVIQNAKPMLSKICYSNIWPF